MVKLLLFLISLFIAIHSQNKQQILLDPSVIMLENENFTQITGLKTPISKRGNNNATHDWFILLYKPLCNLCQKTIPRWNEFAKNVAKGSSNKPVKIGAIDCSTSVELCSEYQIEKYPEAIFMTKDKNRNYKNFKGEYTADGFLRFLNYQVPFPNKQNLGLFSSLLETFKYFTFGSLILFSVLGGFLIFFVYSLLKKDDFQEINDTSNNTLWQQTQKQKI